MKNKILSIDFQIIWKSIHTSLTEDEQALLDTWLAENERHREYYDRAIKHFAQKKPTQAKPAPASLWREIEKIEKVKRTNKRKLSISIAASVAMLAVTAFVFLNISKDKPKSTVVPQQAETYSTPGKKAILKLGDGKTITLGANNSTSTVENGSSIDISGESVHYSAKDHTATTAVAMHEIEIPTGGEFTLILSDGTKIWLNSESSLRYPATFPGDKRVVELTGEAYFEVAHREAQPFEVVTANQTITVLGTSFNVSHYPEDQEIVSTLVAGKVRVRTEDGTKTTLSPGEQAVYRKRSHTITRHQVDVEKYIAWKNGLFYFENEPLERIMVTLSRWYDIEVVYVNPYLKQTRFTGTLKRYETFENVIDIIEMTHDVKFEIKENVITIG